MQPQFVGLCCAKKSVVMIRVIFGALFFLLAACSREAPHPNAETPASDNAVMPASDKETALPALSALSRSEAIPVSVPAAEPAPAPGEPSEAVLRKLEFQRYEEIEKAGGLPVTVTATGRQLVLKPRLYSVRKEKCQPTPQAPAGWYECSLIISLSLAADGSDPSEQGERIGVKWDGSREEWVLQ